MKRATARSALSLLLAAMIISGPAAANQQSFRYDAQGRLRAGCLVRGGDAERSEYHLDPASNRLQYINAATVVVLYAGDRYYSPDRRFFLQMQSEGNLVLYQASPDTALWSTPTIGTGAYVAVQQVDGNLVLYSQSAAVWDTHTNGNDCGQLQLQNDGNLVIYGLDGTALWDSGTGGH